MIETLDIDMIANIESVIGNLKIYKMINDKATPLIDDAKYKVGDFDSILDDLESFMEEAFCAIFKDEEWGWEQATTEKGSMLGYDLMYDEDEMHVTEILIKTDKILKVIDMADKEEIVSSSATTFFALVNQLLAERQSNGQEAISFIAEDNSGIVLLFIDYEIINYQFFENLFLLLDYCDELTKGDEDIGKCIGTNT